MNPIILVCLFVAGSMAHPNGYGYAPAPAPASPVLSYSAPAAPAAPALSYGASVEGRSSILTTTAIPIIHQSNDIREGQGGRVAFETGNGINHEYNLSIQMNPNAVGTPEDADAGKAMITRAGTVSYSAPTGERINLNYVAGDQGFIPSGDHLPTPPSDTKEVADAKVAFQIAYDAAAKVAAEAPEFPASQSNTGSYGSYAPAPASPVRSTY